jgi:hypothetical protein
METERCRGYKSVIKIAIFVLLIYTVGLIFVWSDKSFATSAKDGKKQTVAPPSATQKPSLTEPSPTGVPPSVREGPTLPEFRKDLSMEEVVVSKTRIPKGELFNVTFDVRNLGNTQISQVSYTIYLALSSGNLSLHTGDIHNLLPGSLTGIKREVTIPLRDAIPTGYAYIKAMIDSKNDIAEENENNNSAQVQVYVQAALPPDSPACCPDLVVSDLRLNGEPQPGELFDVDFSIKNIGTEPSPQCRYETSLASYGTIPGISLPGGGTLPAHQGWQVLDRRTYDVRELNPQQVTSGTLRFRMPEERTRIKITLTVDPTNAVRESRDTNNSRDIEWGTTALWP